MSYDKLKTSELNTPAQTEEELDVIEVLDHRALFSNGRIKPEQIPKGLHAYDLRHSDDGGRFCSIGLCFFVLSEDCNCAWDSAAAHGIFCICVARFGEETLIRVQSKLALKICAGLSDDVGNAVGSAFVGLIHIGGNYDPAVRFTYPIQFTKRPARLVKQMDDVRRYDRIKAFIRVGEVQNISLFEGCIFVCRAFFLGTFEHFF